MQVTKRRQASYSFNSIHDHLKAMISTEVTLALDAKEPCALVNLTIPMAVPAKKNFMRSPGAGATTRLVYQRGIKAQMEAIVQVLQLQWSGEPVRHPICIWRIDAPNQQDRDGIITTLLDAMKRARILVDDNIANCNGLWMTIPARNPTDPKNPNHQVTLIWKTSA
jgi:hypothetical protein